MVSVSSPVRSKQSAGGHAAQSTSSLALKAYFQNLLSELTAAAKQLALSEFNSWLVGGAPRAISVRDNCVLAPQLHQGAWQNKLPRRYAHD